METMNPSSADISSLSPLETTSGMGTDIEDFTQEKLSFESRHEPRRFAVLSVDELGSHDLAVFSTTYIGGEILAYLGSTNTGFLLRSSKGCEFILFGSRHFDKPILYPNEVARFLHSAFAVHDEGDHKPCDVSGDLRGDQLLGTCLFTGAFDGKEFLGLEDRHIALLDAVVSKPL